VKKRIGSCFVAAVLSVLGLAACGGGDEEKQEAQQKQQETTQQAAQSTLPQETTQQAAQTSPSTGQSGDLATQLIGTWDATSIQGESVPPGTQTLTFFEDGTLLSTYNDGSSTTDTTAQYSVLDDTRIEAIDQDGTPVVANYSLEGDTLTLDSQGPQGLSATYQRTY